MIRSILPRMQRSRVIPAELRRHVFSTVANERLHTADASTMFRCIRTLEQGIVEPNDV